MSWYIASLFAGKLREARGNLDGVHLVMAGGYDERVVENKEHYTELSDLVAHLDLKEQVTFLRSISDAQKRTLLKYSTCLIYTPDREHFGIVPIESMYMKCPVIAVSSGGPLETVSHSETGFLCEPNVDMFADAMMKIVKDKDLANKLGQAGHDRVVQLFSFETFTNKLNGIITAMLGMKNKKEWFMTRVVVHNETTVNKSCAVYSHIFGMISCIIILKPVQDGRNFGRRHFQIQIKMF